MTQTQTASFMGIPEAWFEDPTWLCLRGHVSERFLKSEVRGALCLACQEPVRMVDPSIEEGVAWHYTVWSRWERIRGEGLVPQPLAKRELELHSYFRDDPLGIYVFPRRHEEGHELAALLIDRVARHTDWHVVELRVEFEPDRDVRWGIPDTSFTLSHNGTFNETWVYHENEPMLVLNRAEQAEITRDWNFLELISR